MKKTVTRFVRFLLNRPLAGKKEAQPTISEEREKMYSTLFASKEPRLNPIKWIKLQ